MTQARPLALSSRSVLLVRHGETAWSRDHRHTGRTDLPLTEIGAGEARALTPWLRGMGLAHVLTSPLLRARDTCALAGFGVVMHLVPELREWDYGEYEDLTLAEIQAVRPGWNLFRDGCPGGESPNDVTERTDAMIAILRPLHGPVALFSHAHILCALAARWIGLTASGGGRFRLDTAAVGVLDVEHDNPDEPSIAHWNVTGPAVP